eukprot:scaffold20058_cov72-Isochrysis_galbana.AAC.1
MNGPWGLWAGGWLSTGLFIAPGHRVPGPRTGLGWPGWTQLRRRAPHRYRPSLQRGRGRRSPAPGRAARGCVWAGR